VSQAAHSDATFGLSHLPPGAQMGQQILLQDATRLNKEAAIDRFVRYAIAKS
jgi:hypothetical protein